MIDGGFDDVGLELVGGRIVVGGGYLLVEVPVRIVHVRTVLCHTEKPERISVVWV
jgi:hypothetical protein